MAVLGITGSSGFIGKEFVKLAGLSHDLRCFSRSGAIEHRLDLTSKIDPEVLAGCDAIIHLAAQLPFEGPDEVQARQCWEANALGTLKLIGAMREAGVHRLIHASSANAYAPWCSFPDEDAPLYPSSRVYYLGSKVAQELYADASRSDHFRVSCVRISSVYGDANSALGRIATSLLAKEKVRLLDDGAFGADFIHVEDVAKALLLVEAHEKDGTFNVASGRRTTMVELAHYLASAAGADPQLIEVDPPAPGAFRGYPAINIAKIRQLGFAPTDLEEGLCDLVERLRSDSRDDPVRCSLRNEERVRS
jgi:UDP-glucose 4-epimerase